MISKEWLNKKGLHGDYYISPFGTENLADYSHVEELSKHFSWVRLTNGVPGKDVLWIHEPGTFVKVLYPLGYSFPVVGLTEPADVRRFDGVKKAVKAAVEGKALAVLQYHLVNHVVGEDQKVTWKRFISDMDFIVKQKTENDLQVIGPLED